ncbi:MAG: ABC transporter permease [Pseudonocardiaceae bacterium]
MRLALWLGGRVASVVVTLLLISMLVFSILYLTPGSPEQVLLGSRPSSPETLAAIRAQYHLDDSLVEQYRQWLSSAVYLDFGESVRSSQDVSAILSERVPVTMFLATYGALIALVVSIPVGLVSGIRNGSFADRVVTVTTTLCIGAPSFVTGFLLLYVFGVALGWFPIYGTGEGLVDRAWHLTLPAIALALAPLAILARQTRASAFSVYHEDFTTFARARGLPRRLVLGRYALRNSSLPVVTTSGLVLAYFLTGTVLIEQVFAIPGVGTLMVEAVSTKDVLVVQALALVIALFVLVANFLADLGHLALDPRVRKGVLG